MRKFILAALVTVIGVAPFLSVEAASAANLPRYSSVTDASATSFTASFRNLSKTEYVTCSLPAPIECTSPSDKAGDNWGGLAGARNEAGTLQVTMTPDRSGAGTVLTAYALRKKSWDKVREWTQAGSVSKVLVAGDGVHFLAFKTDGSVTSYDTSKKAAGATAMIGTTGSALTISSTGKYLAWYKPAVLNGSGQRCYVVADTTTGKNVETCDSVAFWDLVTEDNRVFAFSPDDKNLVFRSDRDGYQSPYRISLASGLPSVISPERLILKPYQVADLVFIDNTHLAVVANRTSATAWSLWNLDIVRGTIAEVASNASYGVPIKRFGSYVSFGRTNAGGVSATLYNVSSGSVTAIETLARTSISAGDTIPNPTTKVSYTTGGGYALWEPSKVAKTTPIVIWLHGGPYRQISTAGYHPFSSYGSFDWMLEQVRLSGSIVAKLDYPGSYGYGRTYAESLTGNVGVTDVAAVKTLIASLKTKYGTSAPIYLVGNSYGGYLADKTLVEVPNSIAGIYSISGVSGWEELLAGYPQSIFRAQFRNQLAGQQEPLYAKAEVLLKASNVGNQKILLAHGDSDTSVGVSQTKTLDEVFKLAKKNVQTTIYAGEDHVFTKPANFVDLCKKAIGLVGGNAAGRCSL